VSVLIALLCTAISTVTDLRAGLIYDAVTAPCAIALAFCALFYGNVAAALAGAVLCGGALFALHAVTRGRGLGLGDVKLGAVIGAGVGGAASIEAIGMAFIAGSIYALPLLAARRIRREDRLPFAPFLAVGTLLYVCGVHTNG
jgi:leader peptidase (prepilin peptidase) / N-methyltransferase